jgi:hypothetical protein
MSRPDDRSPDRRPAWPWLVALLVACLNLGLLFFQVVAIMRIIELEIRDTPPKISSAGPTVVQLERLQYLVSSRVDVADVLVGESR